MLEFLKHITYKTRILILSMFLILMPGAIISYLSMKSIREKADNQKVEYLGTVNLVRDKLEGELFLLESNLRNSILDSLMEVNGEAGLQACLRSAAVDYPAFKNITLVGNNGGLISGFTTLGMQRSGSFEDQLGREFRESLASAEAAEFIEKNPARAIRAYRHLLKVADSPGEKAMLHARIGRNYYKMQQYENGIEEYNEILRIQGGSPCIGNIPASVVALHQVEAGYRELNSGENQKSTLLELFRQLVGHPWDLSGGEYLYYLNTTSLKINDFESSDSFSEADRELIREWRKNEEEVLEQAGFMHQLEGKILGEVMSDLEHMSASETRQELIPSDSGPGIKLSYFRLPPTLLQSRFKGLLFQFDEDHLLTGLFPGVLTTVELGKNLSVGILNENDSLQFIQHNLQLSKYLVTGSFTRFLQGWKVVLFDTEGKTLEQLAGRERHVYLAVFLGIIAVMSVGTIFLVRTVAHESEIARLKSEFISNVTHELKTPLSLIRMFGETLESGIVRDENKRQEFYSIITQESERLTHLINNVLDFSQLDSGRKEYDMHESDIVSIIRHSLEAYKFHIRDLGFEIESNIPAEPVLVPVDEDAISQAFLNLLSNAVKYSGEKKYIRVDVQSDSDSVSISVRDHGIGISRGELKKIFDKFYRVPESRVKHTRGSGLGLTLTKHIIEAHGGSIEVESDPGKGSRFTLRLPLKKIMSGTKE